MKHLVLSLGLLLTGTFQLLAQSKAELASSLKRDLEDYRRFTLAVDFDHSLQYMPPKMFDIVPFDSLKQNMLESMNNEYMSVQMTSFEIDYKKKPKIRMAGAYYWTLVSYTGSMRMNLKGDEEFTKILIPIMKAEFGKENVKMADASTMDVALKNKKLIAFKESADPHWYMIEDKRFEKGEEGESQKALLSRVLPEEVLKALGKK